MSDAAFASLIGFIVFVAALAVVVTAATVYFYTVRQSIRRERRLLWEVASGKLSQTSLRAIVRAYVATRTEHEKELVD